MTRENALHSVLQAADDRSGGAVALFKLSLSKTCLDAKHGNLPRHGIIGAGFFELGKRAATVKILAA